MDRRVDPSGLGRSATTVGSTRWHVETHERPVVRIGRCRGQKLGISASLGAKLDGWSGRTGERNGRRHGGRVSVTLPPFSCFRPRSLWLDGNAKGGLGGIGSTLEMVGGHSVQRSPHLRLSDLADGLITECLPPANQRPRQSQFFGTCP